MTIELMDYQVLAIFLLGLVIGIIVMAIAERRHENKTMTTKEFVRRIFRDLNGRGFENRVIRSDTKVDEFEMTLE